VPGPVRARRVDDRKRRREEWLDGPVGGGEAQAETGSLGQCGSGWVAVSHIIGMGGLRRSEWCKNGCGWSSMERDIGVYYHSVKIGNYKFLGQCGSGWVAVRHINGMGGLRRSEWW
jgi:hypothetical protein